MRLLAFGINHHTAPVAIREQVAFPADHMGEALRQLADRPGVREAAILSTCNRTEIYCNAETTETPVIWLAEYHRLKLSEFEPYLYTLPEAQAAKHAFRVASGLDSMVLGEAQILGQMKTAVRQAEQAGTLGLLLHKLFQRTFSVAKEVRSSTEIGANSVSMAAAAVRLAERIFPRISDQAVLFIGAGEMIELTATHFAAQRPRRIVVANRTLERAELLAGRYGGSGITLNDLPDVLAEFDIIVTSTASPLPIVGKGMVERAIKVRRHRPMFMVDLAVPRDIEAEVGEMDDIFLYTVDDLGAVVREGLDAREGSVAQAEAIIDASVVSFMQWIESRSVVPAIRALRDQAERHRRHEVERAQRMLARGEDPATIVEALSRGLMNKLLHSPSHSLNRSDDTERDALAAAARRLFNLHDQ